MEKPVQRPRRRRLPYRGQRPRRADRGAAHDRAARRPAEADHARRRQGLRRRGLRQRTALDGMRPRHRRTQNTSRPARSAVDGRTTRHAGYAVSQRIRKRIEEAFGWIKTVAGPARTKFRGRERVGWACPCAAAGSKLARLPEAPRRRAPATKALADCRLIGRWRDRRGRPLGIALTSTSSRSGDADRHRAGRRNRLWSHGGLVSMSNTTSPAT